MSRSQTGSNESWFRTLFDDAPVPLVVLDAEDYEILAANKAYLDVTDTRWEEIAHKKLFEAFPEHPDNPDATEIDEIRASLERVRNTGRTDYLSFKEYAVPSREQPGGFKECYRSPVHAPVFDENGKVRYIIQRPENVTELVQLRGRMTLTAERNEELSALAERMQAELLQRNRELQRLNDHLSAAQQVAGVGSWELNVTTNKRIWSDEVYRIMGIRPGQRPRNSDNSLMLVHPDDRDMLMAVRKRVVEGEDVPSVEHRIIRPDGSVRHVQQRTVRRVDRNGEMILYGTIQDITERKEMESALRESEERFRLVARVTADAVWDWNTETGEIWWNDGMKTIFGFNAHDNTRSLEFWQDCVHPEDRARVGEKLDAVRNGRDVEWSDSFRFKRKDGSYAYVQSRGFLIRDENGRAVRMLGSMNDVTQRKEHESRLEWQAALLEKSSDAIFVIDADCRVHYWNRGAEYVYGWRKEEAVGQSLLDLVCNDPGSVRSAVRQVIETGEWNGTLRQEHRSGKSVTIDGTWTLVTDRDDHEKWILAVNTDITETLELEAQLRQAQRLEAVGQLTGGIAHDFNNLLTVVVGNTELLQNSPNLEPRERELLAATHKASLRGADLTHQLLSFSRQQALEPKVTNVNELIRGMEKLLRRTLMEDTQFRFLLQENLWDTYVDPAQLESALLNLCINARDAMKGGGRVVIETSNVRLDDIYVERHSTVLPGDYVMIAVSDSGHGIKQEYLDRVFDPFFTTKEKGKGTGLGLSMAYGFVKQSKGNITIYSEPGQGTTVKIFLPRNMKASERTSESRKEAEPARAQSESVLLVEDDELVRAVAEQQLESLGYEVVTAADTRDALKHLRQDAHFDLLFTDVIMPGGINGRELAERARALQPGIKVLLTSGYTENALDTNDGAEHLALLSKPYRKADLAAKLRQVLDATGATVSNSEPGTRQRPSDGR